MHNAIQSYHINEITLFPFLCGLPILDSDFPIACQSLTYNCLLATNCFPKIAVEKFKNHNVTHSIYKLFELWWTFSAVDSFRNTNVNWGGWPRSGRSCVRVWTIFQEDSTTDSSFTSWPSCYWNISTCLLDIMIIAIVLRSWFWKVSVSPCVVWPVVLILSLTDYLSTWLFINRLSSFSVCELISLCCMLSVLQTQAPHALAPTALKWHGWCWCDIFVFIVT